MKKILLLLSVLFLSSFFLCTPALASPLTITDASIPVGDIDTIHGSAYIFPPNDFNEVTWIQKVVDPGYNISNSYSVETVNWTQTNENENAYALELKGEPGYFFIWLATNPNKNTPVVNAFLYKNLDALTYAVVDISQWTGYTPPDGSINIGRVSHIRQVSEPATMLLFGFGLIGLAVFGRKRFLKGA